MKRHSGISTVSFIYFQIEPDGVPIDSVTEKSINKTVLTKIGKINIDDLSGEFCFYFLVEKKQIEFKCKWMRIINHNL